MEDRIKALEERQEIIEASEYRWQVLVDEQLSALSKIILGNISQMKEWNDNWQEHLKAHYLDKKNQYASKQKRIHKY